jgi:hypothetical protein
MRRLSESVGLFVSTSLASNGGSGSSLTWLWILIAAVVLIAAIVLVLVGRRAGRYFGRDSVVVGGWLSGAIGAYEKGSALHQAISAAQRPGALAADSGARWSDIQRRADDLAQTLHELRRVAPESEDRARVNDALGSLQSLRSAIDAQKAAGGADGGEAEIGRAELDAFEMSLRRLRSPQEHLW